MSLSAIVPYNKNGLGLVSVLINLQLQVRPNDLDTIIVIDTSKDQSGKRIAETFLSRKGINAYVVVKEVNVYEAWNEGIKLSKGKDCLIINDDILMPNNFLKNLKKARELEPNALCFVPRTPVMSYVGSYPPSYFSWQSDDLTDNTKLKKTGWMPGFVFYLTKECIDKVGVFDLGYKIWFSDNDFGRRIKEKGNIIQVPDYVFHYGSRSYNYLNPEIKKQIYKDKNYYERKWKKQDK